MKPFRRTDADQWLHLRIANTRWVERKGPNYITVWDGDECVGRLATVSVTMRSAAGEQDSIVVEFIAERIAGGETMAPKFP